MARPVRLRPSYVDDANFLVRLAQAVTEDQRVPEGWRARVSAQLLELSADLRSALDQVPDVEEDPQE